VHRNIPGLPDFSWYNKSKQEKIENLQKWAQNDKCP
jgi:hypothetical protein